MRTLSLSLLALLVAGLAGCPPEPDPDPPVTNNLGTFETPDGPAAPLLDGGAGPLCAGVDCSALDAPCARGQCDPDTGMCVSAAFPDGSSCVDDNPCTFGDQCVSGACVGEPVVCNAAPCQSATCNVATGACVVTLLTDGAACDDGSVCTGDDSCQAGQCQGTPVDCSSLDSACAVGLCDPAAGCVAAPVADGQPCSDADSCTVPDLCQGGACVNAPVTCQELSTPCQVASCDAATGDCFIEALEPGTACDDGDPCTENDQCGDDGSCGGASVSCPVVDAACRVATCDAVTGACGAIDVADGTGCDDGDTCTVGDVCTAGVCAGAPRDCPSLAGPCQSGTCDPDSGDCLFAPANEGQSCDDDGTDCDDAICVGGACEPAPRAECAACGVAGEDVCSLGTCGPAIADVRTGFEAGVLPSFITTEGDAPWSATLGEAASGAYAARSGAINDGETSSLRLSVSTGANGQLSFMLYAQTEAEQQTLSLHIDGAEAGSWTGPFAWRQVRYPEHPFLPPYFLSPGLHDIELRYSRAGPSAGADYVLVDSVRVVDTPTPIDFETGAFDAGGAYPGGPLGPLVTEGAGSLSVTSDDAAFGASSATLTGVPAGDTGALVWAFEAPRPMSFTGFVRADARPTEGARVTLDGASIGSALGASAWVQIGPSFVSEGAHELRVTFDNASGTEANAIWVDHLALSTGPCGP